jgi:hypothetical protein
MLGRLAYAVRSLAIFLSLTVASGVISLVLLPGLRDYSWDVYLVLQSAATATLAFLFLRQRFDTRMLAVRVGRRLLRRKVDIVASGPRSASDGRGSEGDAAIKERP